ncbi:transposase [Streptomyces sp. 900105245]
MRNRRSRHWNGRTRAPDAARCPRAAQFRLHPAWHHPDLFAALDIATGKVIGKVSARHAAEDFRDFLDLLDHEVEPGLAVHVICDNLSTHKAPAVHKWLVAHPRFALHFTPTY